MSRIAYVNGQYLPHAQAGVHVEDRGYQFADGIYEVMAVRNGMLVDETPHLDRMDRSLRELRITPPMQRAPLRFVMNEVVRRNRVRNGILYLQITRGVARRDHPFPSHPIAPGLVITARRAKPLDMSMVAKGVAVITSPDIRWKRCDIKSVSLLPNILGKQQAKDAGAYEAWMVDDRGMVTEGTSTNAWIITHDDEIITRPSGDDILSGVTRHVVRDLARQAGLSLVERAFSVDEARAAREAFLTSTTVLILPVVKIDDKPIGDGIPGALTLRLRAMCEQAVQDQI